MNSNNFKSYQLNLSGLSFWLVVLAIVWLLGSVGLLWVLKSLLVLFAILIITPIVGFLVFRWWLRRNLITSQCPVCSYELTGINGIELRCPSCSEPLKAVDGSYQRLTPPGTVDVTAIEVPSRQLEE